VDSTTVRVDKIERSEVMNVLGRSRIFFTRDFKPNQTEAKAAREFEFNQDAERKRKFAHSGELNDVGIAEQ